MAGTCWKTGSGYSVRQALLRGAGLLVLVLFAALTFSSNLLGSASDDLFSTQRDGSEALVLGKIIAGREQIDTRQANLGFISKGKIADQSEVLASYFFLESMQAVLPLDVTDEHWNHGIARDWAGLVVPKVSGQQAGYAVSHLPVGARLRFDEQVRTIERIEEKGPYLNVYLSGAPLRLEKDDAHKRITIVDDAKSNQKLRFLPYKSNYGLQGKLYAFFYERLGLKKLEQLQFANVLLLAAVLVAISYCYAQALGTSFGALFLLTMLGSPWIASFARNLYWSPFMWFLPVLFSLMLYLVLRHTVIAGFHRSLEGDCGVANARRENHPVCALRLALASDQLGATRQLQCDGVLASTAAQRWLLLLFTLSFFVKCLAGYEYLSSIVLLSCSIFLIDPFLARPRFEKTRALKIAAQLFALSVFAFLIALLFQASIRDGTLFDGLASIWTDDVMRRTYGDPDTFSKQLDVVASLKAPLHEVLSKYFFEWNTPLVFGIPGEAFPLLVLTSLGFALYRFLIADPAFRRDLALLVFLSAPALSWFVLAKGHSYIHGHLNYVLWYLGFVTALLYVNVSGIALLFSKAVPVGALQKMHLLAIEFSTLPGRFFSAFSRPGKATLLISLFVVSVVARLVLTGDRDILATNSPYDEYWYVTSAMRWIFGGSYHHMVFAQLPVYAVWLKLISLLGLPARLAIDLVWVLACAYLALAVARFCGKAWPAVLLYLFLCFHPYSIAQFDRALSETLLTVLMTLTLAAFIEVWNCRGGEARERRRLGLAVAVACIAFALAYHTRKEGIVMLPSIMLLLAWSLLQRRTWWSAPQRARLALPLIVYPLLATIALGVLLAGANYLRWGVFARYELAAPAYVRAINHLNAVDPGTATPKHVTVTARARAMAYAASPTFSELKSFFEGTQGEFLARHSASFSGVQGEIGNGWFYWGVRDAASIAGWHASAETAEKKYGAMADELEKAFADGRLKKRWVPVSFVDPDWRKWLPQLPHAFIGAGRLIADPAAGDLQLGLQEDARPNQYDDFVSIVGRRRSPERNFIEGWLITPPGSAVGFGIAENSFSMQPLQGETRPDVPGARAFKLVSGAGELPTELHIRDAQQKLERFALADLKAGMMKHGTVLAGATLGVDAMSAKISDRIADRLLPALIKIWSWLGWLLAGAGLAALLLYRRGDGAAVLVMTAALAAIVARAAVLALLDASSWSGLHVRYLFPVVPCFALFGTLGLWLLARRFSAQRIHTPRPAF